MTMQKLIYPYNGACISMLIRTGILSDFVPDLDMYCEVMKLNTDLSLK